MGDSSTEQVPVIVVGLGEVGRDVARAALASPMVRLVGAADPAHAGTALAELVSGAPTALEVASRAADLYGEIAGGVALFATVSLLDEAVDALAEAAGAGVNVVSTCEELSFPWLGHPEAAAALEEAFTGGGVTCLGTGVNPGFVLDRLPAVLGGICGEPRHLLARRVVDVATRRAALQKKVGAGLDEDAFASRVEDGTIGHVGLLESVALAAEGLGLPADEVEDEVEPVIASVPFDTGAVRGPAGAVAGVRQTARAFSDGREVVRLELTMAVDAEASRDEVILDADPRIELEVKGGVPGEAATAWALVRAAPQVAFGEPGIMTVLDLPAGR